MYTVLGLNMSPFVRKVRVALGEKQLAYVLEARRPSKDPEYLKLSPLGKVPVLVVGDRGLCDSSVILAYLERKETAVPLLPSDDFDAARALWFEEYGDSALSAVAGKIMFQRILGPMFYNRPTDEVAVKQAIEVELPPVLAYLNGELEGKTFLVAEMLTLGDVGVITHFFSLKHSGVGVDAGQYPHLAAYVERMLARPVLAGLWDEESAPRQS